MRQVVYQQVEDLLVYALLFLFVLLYLGLVV